MTPTHFRCTFFAGLLLSGLHLLVYSQTSGLPPSPVEVSGFRAVTPHATMLTYLRTLANASSRIVVESIGRSSEGRELVLVRASNSTSRTAAVRVLVQCSQHGNEAGGKEAILVLLREIAAGEHDDILRRLDLLVIPSMNPDGNEARRRQNGAGKDLNRRHLLLDQPEVRAAHDVFYRWKPEVTLDVHEFGAGGKAWTDAGLVRTMDEQFGAPTNPNVSAALRQLGTDRMFPDLDRALGTQGVRFFNYSIVGSPTDTVRHSTTDINDGRQSFAILQTYSFILEGRNGPGFDAELDRRVRNQRAAIEAFLQWVAHYAEEIRSVVDHERQAEIDNRTPVALVMDHRHNGETTALPVRSIATGHDTTATLPYAPTVVVERSVERPAAYMIRSPDTSLVGFLDRHHISYRRLLKARLVEGEEYTVDSIAWRPMEGDSVLTTVVRRRGGRVMFAAGDLVVPLRQMHSSMLVIALEPESIWGLIQYPEFAWLRMTGISYPVFRVMRDEEVPPLGW